MESNKTAEFFNELENSFEKQKILLELYDSLSNSSAEDEDELKRNKIKINLVKNDLLELTLSINRIIKEMQKAL